MSDFQFMKGEVYVATGTLQQFKVKYDQINSVAGQTCKASSLFPNGEKIPGGNLMMYEYCIFYTADPNRNKKLDTGTGKVVDKKEVPLEQKGTMKNPLTEKDILI